MVCGHASGTGHHRRAQDRCRQGSSDENRGPLRRDLGLCGSCGTLPLRLRVGIELAEQTISVTLGTVSQLQDEVLNLFPTGLPERSRAAEVDGVGLDQFGVELVLTDDLAQTIADLGASAVA